MLARIYKPARSAMQQGKRNENRWVLEFEAEEAREIEPLMGWTSSGETEGQVRIFFDTREEAVAFAQRHGIPHEVLEEEDEEPRQKSYSDNFAYDRVEPWTH